MYVRLSPRSMPIFNCFLPTFDLYEVMRSKLRLSRIVSAIRYAHHDPIRMLAPFKNTRSHSCVAVWEQDERSSQAPMSKSGYTRCRSYCPKTTISTQALLGGYCYFRTVCLSAKPLSLVIPAGLEPATCSLEVSRSIQLSYGTAFKHKNILNLLIKDRILKSYLPFLCSSCPYKYSCGE